MIIKVNNKYCARVVVFCMCAFRVTTFYKNKKVTTFYKYKNNYDTF